VKKSLLATGQRKTPSWVAERLADRPPWRCHTDDQRDWFMEFVIEELKLRMIYVARANADIFARGMEEPTPADGREKRWIARAFDDAESAARAVPIIREIFEDYWTEGREVGRVYRGHDPSAEMIAAKYANVSVHDVERVLKRSKKKRPAWK
jgi:hypothetical protein